MQRLIIAGGQQGAGQHLEFPFNTLKALPPYLSPVGHQRGDLTFDWQVCSVLQAALEKKRNQGGSEEKTKKKQSERFCHEKAERRGAGS